MTDGSQIYEQKQPSFDVESSSRLVSLPTEDTTAESSNQTDIPPNMNAVAKFNKDKGQCVFDCNSVAVFLGAMWRWDNATKGHDPGDQNANLAIAMKIQQVLGEIKACKTPDECKKTLLLCQNNLARYYPRNTFRFEADCPAYMENNQITEGKPIRLTKSKFNIVINLEAMGINVLEGIFDRITRWHASQKHEDTP